MTCIIGVETEDGVLIGADSAGTNSAGRQIIRTDEKVFESGEFVYGFAGSYRMGQILRYSLTIPQTPHLDADQAARDKWMSTVYIDAARKALKDGGSAQVYYGVESGGFFIVGWRGTLYTVESDFQVGRPADGFDAFGSGATLAVGAFEVLRRENEKKPEHSPKQRATMALEAAAKFNSGVAGPFHFVQGKKPKELKK